VGEPIALHLQRALPGRPSIGVSMPRFVVRHQHSPESYPASDPAMGAVLLNHLSPPNAARYGVVIQSEAVVSGAHTLSFIADTADETGLRAFLTPLRDAGEVEILAASTHAEMVASGGCDARPPLVLAAAIRCFRVKAQIVLQHYLPIRCLPLTVALALLLVGSAARAEPPQLLPTRDVDITYDVRPNCAFANGCVGSQPSSWSASTARTDRRQFLSVHTRDYPPLVGEPYFSSVGYAATARGARA
jgi:hypothetical protein